jgi:hypothetical protein
MQISKERKIELFIVGLLSLVILSSFINFKNIHVKFHNKTGEDLDSLIVAGTLIGHLKSNSSTEYIDFKEFRFDDDLPYEQISSIIIIKKYINSIGAGAVREEIQNLKDPIALI